MSPTFAPCHAGGGQWPSTWVKAAHSWEANTPRYCKIHLFAPALQIIKIHIPDRTQPHTANPTPITPPETRPPVPNQTAHKGHKPLCHMTPLNPPPSHPAPLPLSSPASIVPILPSLPPCPPPPPPLTHTEPHQDPRFKHTRLFRPGRFTHLPMTQQVCRNSDVAPWLSSTLLAHLAACCSLLLLGVTETPLQDTQHSNIFTEQCACGADNIGTDNI